jgi:tetrahydromethanopterin S-methyltransferase subunit A
VLHHYNPDHSPAHEIRGKSAEAILRAALRAQLVSQLSHAGYLGSELSKAESALRLGLYYEQDHPLRPGAPKQKK